MMGLPSGYATEFNKKHFGFLVRHVVVITIPQQPRILPRYIKILVRFSICGRRCPYVAHAYYRPSHTRTICK